MDSAIDVIDLIEDEKKEEYDNVTEPDTLGDEQPNRKDELSIQFRLTKMEHLVHHQSTELRSCRSELLVERAARTKLQKRVIAMQTDMQAAELERLSAEEIVEQTWEANFVQLQKQVLAIIKELDWLKDDLGREANSLRELSSAVKHHSSDQLDQRQEINALTDTVKQKIEFDCVDSAHCSHSRSCFDESSVECRMRQTVAIEKQADICMQSASQKQTEEMIIIDGSEVDYLVEAVQELSEKSDACLSDLGSRLDVVRQRQLEAEKKTNKKIEKLQHQLTCFVLQHSSHFAKHVEEHTEKLQIETESRARLELNMIEQIQETQMEVDEQKAAYQAQLATIEQQARQFTKLAERCEKIEDSLTQSESSTQKCLDYSEYVQQQFDHTNRTLKELTDRLDTFRGRLEHVHLDLPQLRSDLVLLREIFDAAAQASEKCNGSLSNRLDCLSQELNESNQARQVMQIETGLTLEDLRQRLDIELTRVTQLLEQSHWENRGLQKMLHDEIQQRTLAVDESNSHKNSTEETVEHGTNKESSQLRRSASDQRGFSF